MVRMSSPGWLVVIDIAVIVGASVGFGAVAPRWPDRWLEQDRFPLTLLPWETPRFYRRLGVVGLARRLPEWGAAFGGESKARLPGTGRAELASYLREVRRAEWVHWLSIAASVVLLAFNPWWLAVAFVVAVAAGNTPFILILRNNRVRIRRIIGREEEGRH
jgi:Glycosyl-4,4'-diaponeurosporenoate acyltransferase